MPVNAVRRARRWWVTGGVCLLVLVGLGMVAFAYHTANIAKRQSGQTAIEALALSKALCGDLHTRSDDRRRSDAASAKAWGGIARELYAALSAVPPRRRTPKNLHFTWVIWADAHHAAAQFRDRSLRKPIVPCR